MNERHLIPVHSLLHSAHTSFHFITLSAHSSADLFINTFSATLFELKALAHFITHFSSAQRFCSSLHSLIKINQIIFQSITITAQAHHISQATPPRFQPVSNTVISSINQLNAFFVHRITRINPLHLSAQASPRFQPVSNTFRLQRCTSSPHLVNNKLHDRILNSDRPALKRTHRKKKKREKSSTRVEQIFRTRA